MSTTPFFPSIGSVAVKADQLPDNTNPEADHAEPDSPASKDRPLHEIESLCMKCGEQVSYRYFSACLSHWGLMKGYDSNAPYFHPIFPRSDRSFLSMRTLWKHEQ